MSTTKAVTQDDLRVALRMAWGESQRQTVRLSHQRLTGLVLATWRRLETRSIEWTRAPMTDAQALALASDLLYYCGVRPDALTAIPPHELAGGVRMVLRKYGLRNTTQTDP